MEAESARENPRDSASFSCGTHCFPLNTKIVGDAEIFARHWEAKP